MNRAAQPLSHHTGRLATAIDLMLALGAFLAGGLWTLWVIPLVHSLIGQETWGPIPGATIPTGSLGRATWVIHRWLHAVPPLLAPPTLVVVVLRLRRPFRSIARCFRQPGFAACAIASLFLLFETINHIVNLTMRLDTIRLRRDLTPGVWVYGASFSPVGCLSAMALSLGATPGLAVGGAFLALWATGRWRSEKTWLDRSGRAIGWIWIVVALGFFLLPLGD